MGGLSSGRRPHWGGPLKQVALKWPVKNEWFILAKRIASYKDKSFSEFVRDCVYREVKRFQYEKMWRCECTDEKGKLKQLFKRTHYCSDCGQYQTEHHKKIYNKASPK